MKKFISKAVAMALPALFILVLTNYIGDSAKLFDKEYEKEIAEIVINGKNATNIQNYDERLFQEYLIRKEQDCPHTIVLGSSRTMLINSDYVSNTLLNNSVSGASIEDIISIYQLYKDKGMFPKKAIIGIDPWTFNENNNQKRWQSIASYYYRFHNKEVSDTIDSDLEKLRQLVSFTYFKSSLGNLPETLTGSDKPVATEAKYNHGNTRLYDGSLKYGKVMREITDEKVDSRIQNFLSDEIYGLDGFEGISERIWNEFVMLINDMHANGIEIEFFLAPYHPDVYNKITEDYPMVLTAEKLIIKHAGEKNIKITGSFNPDIAGLNKNHFYDAMHCSEEGVRILLNTGTMLNKNIPAPMLVSK